MIFHFVFTVLMAGVAIAKVPDYIPVCGRRNPELNGCVIKSVVSLQPRFAKGIPELDVPSLEPLDLIELVVSNATSFRAVAKDAKLWGFPNFAVQDLNVDLEKRKISIEVFFKTITLIADYDVSTRIVVPIVGKGRIHSDALDVKANALLKFDLVDHKGGKYLYFPSMTTKLSIKDYTSKFTSLDGTDGPLAEGINSALRESRGEIIETITPNLEKVISGIVLKLANKICKHFTYDELFPDRE